MIREKFKNIELLRIVGCLAIISLHLFQSTDSFLGLNTNLNIFNKLAHLSDTRGLAVDLFFMLSGLFFALNLDTAISMGTFIKKKVIRLYPVLLFCLVISYIMGLLGVFQFNFYQSLFTLFGLNGTVFSVSIGNWSEVAQAWYVSALFWALVLFFYLLKNYDKKNVNMVIGILVGISYVAIAQFPTLWEYQYNCLAMSIGGIGMGYFIGLWYNVNREKIRMTSIKIPAKILITIIEFMCTFFIINNLLFHKVKYANKVLFILIFALTIVLYMSRKGYISEFLDKFNWFYLSRYTYSLYMIHCFVILTFKKLLWETHINFVTIHPIYCIVATIITIFISGILLYHFVERPMTEKLTIRYSK